MTNQVPNDYEPTIGVIGRPYNDRTVVRVDPIGIYSSTSSSGEITWAVLQEDNHGNYYAEITLIAPSLISEKINKAQSFEDIRIRVPNGISEIKHFSLNLNLNLDPYTPVKTIKVIIFDDDKNEN